MLENPPPPLMPWPKFKRRVIRYGGYSAALLAVSLIIGVLGFHWLAGQPGLDALLNSAMLLGGMGPVGEIKGTSGKLFAAAYALYAGLVFFGAVAIAFAPVLHRVLHKLHLESMQGNGGSA